MSGEAEKRASLNRSTGLVGVWRDKFAEGEPTYKLLADGTAQFIQADEESEGTGSISGFGKWELSPNGQVTVACKVKKGCVTETEAASGTEEHVLNMHCMMFEGVYKRQKELNDRDEERVKLLAEGKEAPPLHPLTVIDLEGYEKSLELFQDEKLSDLKDRLGIESSANVKVMLDGKELVDGKALYGTVPAKSVLTLVVPEVPATAPAPTDEASGKKENIIQAFLDWDINNEKVIPEEDLSRILVALGVPQEDISTIFAEADAKKTGGVDYSQLINWIYSDDEPAPDYEGPYKDQLNIVTWMFPNTPQTLILEMLTEKNGDRPAVTKALQQQGYN